MDKNSAKQVLECWIACPCAFSHGQCQLGEEESCEKGCWSPKQVKEAVVLLLGINLFGRRMMLRRYVNDETRAFMEEQFADCLDLEQLLDLYADFQCVLRELMHDTSKSLIEKN